MTEQGDMWARYAVSKDPGLREALILQYTWLVKYVIGRMAIHIPDMLEYTDIVSYGTIGLVRAVDRYMLSRGVPFEGFAKQLIRGSILDALRDLNMLSRFATDKIKRLEKAIAALEQEYHRTPSDGEIAAYLCISLAELHEVMKCSGYSLVSLDSPINIGDEEGPVPLLEIIPDERGTNPLQAVEDEETRQALLAAIDRLPEKERLVLSLYYRDELTLREIGEILGVTASRINQLHTKAVLRLRGALRAFYEGAEPAPESRLHALRT